jgi:hypothetical protein
MPVLVTAMKKRPSNRRVAQRSGRDAAGPETIQLP